MDYSLISEARKFVALGYEVGLTHGKNLIGNFSIDSTMIQRGKGPDEVNGISIILTDIVCVDFDSDLSMDLGWGYDLPSTLKERSPRGFHLFYQLNVSDFSIKESKIKWKPNVDLLTKGKTMRIKNYDEDSSIEDGSKTAQAHVLVAPSSGYRRIYPDVTPAKDQLTMAPDWLQNAIRS